jgi:regulator of ribonuclease activity A
MLGDKNAQLAADNGWEGFVVNGVVRDAARLATIDIGIKALGTSPRKSKKNGEGRINVPIALGGVIFEPGVLVVADEDGVVVLPR